MVHDSRTDTHTFTCTHTVAQHVMCSTLSLEPRPFPHPQVTLILFCGEGLCLRLPYYSTPHHSTPPTTPRHSTPLHTTHHTTPHHTTPHHTTPHHTTPHHTTPHHTTPLHSTPHHSTPLHTTPHLIPDMNAALTEVLLKACVSPVLLADRFALEHTMLVAILHSNVGSEVGRQSVVACSVKVYVFNRAIASLTGDSIFCLPTISSCVRSFLVADSFPHLYRCVCSAGFCQETG